MTMSRHLEQVLAHAESRLAATGARRPTEALPLYKKFLKVEEHRLRLNHQAGGGGREICARRAELVDVLLRYVFGGAAATTSGNGESRVPLALIALGGYGRGELNPFSDIDVMVLHHQRAAKISPDLEEMVNQVLYLLWDSGFKVGHSTRSIKEAIAQANADMRTKTAMLKSRFLAGDSELARKFREQFRLFFFSSRRRHTILTCDWSSDVCSSDLERERRANEADHGNAAGKLPHHD